MRLWVYSSILSLFIHNERKKCLRVDQRLIELDCIPFGSIYVFQYYFNRVNLSCKLSDLSTLTTLMSTFPVRVYWLQSMDMFMGVSFAWIFDDTFIMYSVRLLHMINRESGQERPLRWGMFIDDMRILCWEMKKKRNKIHSFIILLEDSWEQIWFSNWKTNSEANLHAGWSYYEHSRETFRALEDYSHCRVRGDRKLSGVSSVHEVDIFVYHLYYSLRRNLIIIVS